MDMKISDYKITYAFGDTRIVSAENVGIAYSIGCCYGTIIAIEKV